MANYNRVRQLRLEDDNLSQARLAKQIDGSRQTLAANLPATSISGS